MKQIIGLLAWMVLFALLGCGGGGGIGTSANASPPNLLLAGVGKTIQINYGTYGDVFAYGAVSESYPNVYSQISIQGQLVSFTDNTGKDIITTSPVTIKGY